MIAGLGVAAGQEPQLGEPAAAYVLLLALAGPLLMRFSNVLLALGGPQRRQSVGRERSSVSPGYPPGR